jgi:polar amino acid transport system substrate-binding protein
MIPKRSILTCALVFVLAACGGGRDSDTILVATEAGYPPFEYVDEKGEIVGFDIDLLRAVAAEAGLNVEFQNQPFDGIIPGLKAGRYDAAVSAMTITADRAKAVHFSDPYYDAGQIITVREAESSIQGVADLKGKVIAVQLNTTGHLEAKKVGAREVRTFESIEPAFLELLKGRADAVINDDPTTRLIVSKKEGLRIIGKPFTEEKYGIAVRQGNETLLARINEGLKKVRASGAYDRIKARWIGTGR